MGPQGPRGAPGPVGLQGEAGKDGKYGLDGRTGPVGPIGIEGTDGVGIEKVWVDDRFHLTIRLTAELQGVTPPVAEVAPQLELLVLLT
jgi:hypothetical protein